MRQSFHPAKANDTSSLYSLFFEGDAPMQPGNQPGQFVWLLNSLVFSYTSFFSFTTNNSLTQIQNLFCLQSWSFAMFSLRRIIWGETVLFAKKFLCFVRFKYKGSICL